MSSNLSRNRSTQITSIFRRSCTSARNREVRIIPFKFRLVAAIKRKSARTGLCPPMLSTTRVSSTRSNLG